MMSPGVFPRLPGNKSRPGTRGYPLLTFDHSGWWFLILHCNDTAVMKSYSLGVSSLRGEKALAAGRVRRTHVLANVLNLKDRSMPCPSAVRVHLLLRSPSSSFVRRGSSEPSENFGDAAMAAVLENGRVEAMGFRCWDGRDAGLRILSPFIFI